MENTKSGSGASVWMSCCEVISCLGDYVDGTASDEQRRALERHFKLCPPCREFLLQYRAIPKLVAKVLSASDHRRGGCPKEVAERLSAFLKEKCCCGEGSDNPDDSSTSGTDGGHDL